MAIALSPFAFGGDDRPDPVNAAVVTGGEFEKAFDENDIRVVILAGVGRLSDSSIRKIAAFVNDGGALVVFDGPSVRADLYNRPWINEDDQLSFPAKLGAIVGDAKNGDPSQNVYTIDKPASLYHPWRMLSRGDENPLADVSVAAFRELEIDYEGRC